jgi:hypothetical protein
MSSLDLRRDVRAAISMAYELSRHEHIQQKVHIAQALAELEFELTRIEAKLGGPHADEAAPTRLNLFVGEVKRVVADAGTVVAGQINALVASVGDIQRRLFLALPSQHLVSRRVFGALPLARVVPQEVHTGFDYAVGFGALASALFASSGRGKLIGAALGLGAIGAALFSDHRFGAKKLVSIENHHLVDCALGVAAVAAPFALGYARRDRGVAALHVGIGCGLLAAAALTDYRSATGVGRESDEEADPQHATIA